MNIRNANSLVVMVLFLMNWRTYAASESGYEVEKISDNSYVFTYKWSERSKTNIGVVEGESGFLLINTMMIGQVQELEEALRKISDKPVQYVINSNSDWYNTSANKYFADKGAVVISHQDAVYNLNTYTQLLFSKSIELKVGDEIITATHSKAHSAGHVNIHLQKANAIFVADSYSPRWLAPLGPNGIEGQLDNLKKITQMSDDKTKIIPGNVAVTAIASRKDVTQELETRPELFARVSQLQTIGKKAAQIIADDQVQQLLSNYEEYSLWKDKTWLIDRIKFHNLKTQQKQLNDTLQDYVGRYSLPDGREINVFVKDDVLHAKSEGIFYFDLVKAGADKFWFNSENFAQSMTFVRDEKRNVAEIKVTFEPESEHHLRRLETLKIVKSI